MYKINKLETSYLLGCDLINKYNLKSIYNKPILKSIIIYFSWQKLDLRKSSLRQKLDPESVFYPLQIKTFLFLFLFWGTTPKLNVKKPKTKNVDFAFKIILNTVESIFDFLVFFVIENFSNLDDMKENSEGKFFPRFNTFQISTKVTGYYFSSADYLFKSIFKKFKLRFFEINISFVFKKNINATNKFSSNCFLLWTQGLL